MDLLNLPEGDESPVELQPTEEEVANVENVANAVVEASEGDLDPRLFLELGDQVWIDSTKYGGPVIGHIYFRETDLIRVMPNGINNRLYDFPRVITEDTDTFDEDLGVRVAYVIKKRPFERFVELQDLQVGQTFQGASADGEPVGNYRIVAIDLEKDSALIEDEGGAQTELAFEFAGIPRDAPFEIIQITGFAGAIKEGDVAATTAVRDKAFLAPGDIRPEAIEGNFVEDEVEVPLSQAGEAAEAAANAAETAAAAPKFQIEFIGSFEVPVFEATEELKLSERIYPDSIQKIDALNDLLNLLDPQEQKSIILQRSIRILMETLFNLKQQTISLSPDGRIRGVKKVSARFLSDLFHLGKVPMGRPVLNVALKLIFSDTVDYFLQSDEIPKKTEDYYSELLSDFIEKADEYQTQAQDGQVAEPGSPAFFKNLATYILQSLDATRANTQSSPIYETRQDGDYFRRDIPDRVDLPIQGLSRGSFVMKKPEKGQRAVTGRDTLYEAVGPAEIAFSLRRTLGSTLRKDVDNIGKLGYPASVLLPAERATVSNFILMPIDETSSLGATRTGSLATDIANSREQRKIMSEILAKYGDPTNTPSANGFILLNPESASMGDNLTNIPLSDYLRPQKLSGFGLGDFRPFLANLGLDTLEYTQDLIEVLGEKITKTQNSLLAILNAMREAISQKEGEVAAAAGTEGTEGDNSKVNIYKNLEVLTESARESLDNSIRKEPILVDALEQFKKINPTLSESSLAEFTYLVKNFGDYLYAALGEQATQVARERLRATREIFLGVIEASRREKLKISQAGQVPEPNRCEHVAKLNTVRKIRDDQERFILLAKLLTKYQGLRSGNYIECSICNEHLMCVHERLAIQAFLNPRERDQIQKEIYLNFSGGQFQGKFICRNCGQPLSEIPYDQNIEFDDEGRPMMGRAVMDTTGGAGPVGEDAERLLELALGAQIGSVAEISFADPIDDEIYKTVKEIADRLGVPLDQPGYKRTMESIKGIIGKLPSAAKYAEMKSKLDAARKARTPDYAVYRAQNLVITTGAMLLVEIQTHIPDYVIRHSIVGCQASFEGYPIGAAENKLGVNYMACAIASIRKDQSPWRDTTFMKEKNQTALQTKIAINIINLLDKTLPTLPILSLALADKRKYIETITGRDPSKRIRDEVGKNFLPLLENITLEEAAAKAVVADAATEVQKVQAWIRSAHALARSTAVLMIGSPYLETTCCLSNISSPFYFFTQSQEKFPVLAPRALQPLTRNKFLQVHFEPRRFAEIAVAPQKELNYRLFLSVCFRGPRKGLPHEIGLTNICRWCSFQFPGYPKDIRTDVEGLQALEKQGVDTNTSEFQGLLDSIHLAYSTEPYKAPVILGRDEILNKISNLTPPPVISGAETDRDWKTLSQDTFRTLVSLGNATREQRVVALGDLSQKADEVKTAVITRLPSVLDRSIMEDIVGQSWINFINILESYFIINSNKIVENNDLAIVPFYSVPKTYELSYEHKKTVIDSILKPEIKIVTNLIEALKPKDDKKKGKSGLGDFVRGKLGYYIKQLKAIYELLDKIRPGVLPGGADTLKYLKEIMWYGPLAYLLNPDVYPSPTQESGVTVVAPDGSVYGSGGLLLMNFIHLLLLKYNVEKLSYDDKKIRDLIEVRNEKERQNIIKEFDDLDEEMRGVELTKKHLGIGKWAFGASKAVYAYDPEQWDRERKEREKAGISDFPGIGPDGEAGAIAMAAAGEEMRMFSAEGIFGNSEFYDDVNGGYDNAEIDGEQ